MRNLGVDRALIEFICDECERRGLKNSDVMGTLMCCLKAVCVDQNVALEIRLDKNVILFAVEGAADVH